jgi:hypothetical protein
MKQWIPALPGTALLVIQIMPVKYSIVKDQTHSTLLIEASKTPKIIVRFPDNHLRLLHIYCRPYIMVGLGRLELPTSPLSGVRSNHLSYRPLLVCAHLQRCQNWWSWSGSNRRPPECKSGALPAELQPQKNLIEADWMQDS